MKAKDLPVYKQKQRILEALDQNQVIVVESPTGSGKTTQLPIILNEAGYTEKGIIGITQPRRIATLSVCEYIAGQLNVKIPSVVGYKMRFEDETLPETRIKILTDGTLLQELKGDPLLGKYSVVMVDEAHERSLNIDFVLGLLKNILKARSDFKVIISSATINTEIFSRYFDHCPVVSIDTQTWPVDLFYESEGFQLNPDQLPEKIYHVIEEVEEADFEGDVLVFLSGEKIIKDSLNFLATSPLRHKLHLVPLYGRLSKEEQEKIFIPTPQGKRKVVLSTNIAETSVTIDGITVVIDSGLAKINYYNPHTYTSSLLEMPISRASANQRKGRAGRTQAGRCYRLYTQNDFKKRDEYTLEEIFRTDLSEVVLRMAELGISNFESFDFLSSPDREAVHGAVETLNLLDALGPDRLLSDIGQKMALFPLLPRLSRILIEAVLYYPQIIGEALIIVAFLSTRNPYSLPPGEEIEARRAHHKFRDRMGDFLAYINMYRQFKRSGNKEKFCKDYYLDEKILTEIVNIVEQLEEIIADMGVPLLSGGSTKDLLCATARGLVQFVCVRVKNNTYRSLKAEKIIIHPGSVLFRANPPYIVAGEIVKTSRMFARSVSLLDKKWLEDIHPVLGSGLLEKRSSGPQKQKGAEKSFQDKAEDDKSNSLWLNGKTFPIQESGRKKWKTVLLDWGELSDLVRKSEREELGDFKGLRGKVLWDRYEIMPGAKVNNILSAAYFINPKKDFRKNWPKGRNYNSTKAPQKVLDLLEYVLKLAVTSKQKRVLNFLSLQTDGKGMYFIKPGRSFHSAILDTLSSLESLADDLIDSELEDEGIKQVSRLYQGLDKILQY